jgi:hypothetical protein
MEGTAMQTLQSLLKQPQVSRSADGAAWRRFNDYNFFIREDGMQEGILAVTMLLDLTLPDSNIGEE